jgi:alkaline phosphatase
MQLIIKQIRRGTTALAIVPLLGCCLSLHAAPKVTRLTPPSELFSSGDASPPIIARFLPGQRFDLQATISPDAGQTIAGAQFLLDGAIIPNAVTWAPATVAGKPANTVVASVRAFSISEPGIHTVWNHCHSK